MTTEIAQSFLGSLLALFVAGLSWFIKSAYDKHRKTSLSIARFERGYVENIAILDQDTQLIRGWIEAIKMKHRYAFPPFTMLSIDNESHFSLDNMSLVNLIIKTNFQQKNLNDDLSGLYSFHEKTFSYFLDKKINEEQWRSDEENILPVLEKMIIEIPKIQSDMIRCLAYLRLAGRARFHSMFNYLHLLSIDVWPRITTEEVEHEIKVLDKEREDSVENRFLRKP